MAPPPSGAAPRGREDSPVASAVAEGRLQEGARLDEKLGPDDLGTRAGLPNHRIII